MRALVIFLLLLFPVTVWANIDPLDSIQKTKKENTSNLKLSTRLHSMGQFSYGGRIVSDNPTLDFNFTYDRKTWGLQVFKAMDLHNEPTQINFMLAVINKNFHLGRKLTITPSAGFILEQCHSMADKGSDVTLILTTGYKISKSFTIEHSTLFGNLVMEQEYKDWVNRFRILYSKNHIDMGLMAWHNNKVFDSAEYMTFGSSLFYSRVRLSPALMMNAGVTGLLMPYSNDIEDYPKKNGIIVTVGLVLD
ncbi:MAG: hypothetical protein HOP08_13690 [Cyclobacteriaceae bacterium]|nr:hypothetical protein [Cyclobacteriaceae bacterium]